MASPPAKRRALRNRFPDKTICEKPASMAGSRASPDYSLTNDPGNDRSNRVSPHAATLHNASPPTSVVSPSQTHLPPTKTLTCYFWAKQGWCRYADEDCLYAHYHTGKNASGPVQVEPGRPAVAGKNAASEHPIYENWRSINARQAIDPEIKEQLEHIKAKAKIASPHHADYQQLYDQGIPQRANYQDRSGQYTPQAATHQPNDMNRAVPYHQAHDLWVKSFTQSAVIGTLASNIDDLVGHLQLQSEAIGEECEAILRVFKTTEMKSMMPPGNSSSCLYGEVPDPGKKLISYVQSLMRNMEYNKRTVQEIKEMRNEVGLQLEGIGAEGLLPNKWVER